MNAFRYPTTLLWVNNTGARLQPNCACFDICGLKLSFEAHNGNLVGTLISSTGQSI